jgi:hypothetical protein
MRKLTIQDLTPWCVAASLAAAPAAAQQPPAEPTAQAIGVSLKNIRRQLDATPAPKRGAGLRLEYRVDVIGKPPPVDFFKDFNVKQEGGVRYGGPTHQELVDAMTPLPFRNHGGASLLPAKKK